MALKIDILKENQKRLSAEAEWYSQKKVFHQGLKYIQARKTGEIESLKSPWNSLNNATVNGFEWGSMIVMAARPGSGKTCISDQIVDESFDLNPNSKHRVLQFQLEMPSKALAIRKFSSKVNLSYNDLCSATTKLNDIQFQACVRAARDLSGKPIDIYDKSCTVSEFERIISNYMIVHSNIEEVVDNQGQTLVNFNYTNTIVTLDHSLLLTKEKGQSEIEMLFALGKACTNLKRKYPIIFIILSQLNRNVETPERNENGKYGNYVLPSDIYGSDGLVQHAETVIGWDLPYKRNIQYYGPNKYIITGENMLFMHVLKSRSGNLGISHFVSKFENMKIEESPSHFPKKH